MKFFLKEGPTKSVSNYGEICIDEVVGAMKNNNVIALEGENNAIIIPKQNISHVIIHKEVTG
ncbi:hypothetical protein B7932_10490 [Streptococcus agalactiae]|nr:hypothetical protein B7932_10490 [Streptococcus agalactiae]